MTRRNFKLKISYLSLTSHSPFFQVYLFEKDRFRKALEWKFEGEKTKKLHSPAGTMEPTIEMPFEILRSVTNCFIYSDC